MLTLTLKQGRISLKRFAGRHSLILFYETNGYKCSRASVLFEIMERKKRKKKLTFLIFVFYKNRKIINSKKKDAAPKKDAGGDDQLVFFFYLALGDYMAVASQVASLTWV